MAAIARGQSYNSSSHTPKVVVWILRTDVIFSKCLREVIDLLCLLNVFSRTFLPAGDKVSQRIRGLISGLVPRLPCLAVPYSGHL